MSIKIRDLVWFNNNMDDVELVARPGSRLDRPKRLA